MSTPVERPSYEYSYAEHLQPLTRFTRRLATRYGLPDPNRDAEDIVQATFEDALHRWSLIDNPAAWLYTVARRKVVRAAKEAAQLGTLTDADRIDRTQAGGWTSVALRPTTEDTILARQVMDAIARLPGRRRTITYLRHVQGWTVREVADLLDCAPGTIWAATSHGVGEVREHLLATEIEVQGGIIRRDAAHYAMSRSGCLPGIVAAAFVLALTVTAWLVGGSGWSLPWPEIGLGGLVSVGIVVLAVAGRISVRLWRRRRVRRS